MRTHLAHNAHRPFDAEASRRYDNTARRWLRGFYRHVAEDVAATAPSGGQMLDVGTGPGLLLLEVARRRPDLQIVGSDVSPDMVARARTNIDGAGVSDRVTTEVADVTNLPYDAQRFDVVVSTLAWHHWPRPADAANELARVCRPGGEVRIYDFWFATKVPTVAELERAFGGAVVRRWARPYWLPVLRRLSTTATVDVLET